jgi:hypothetical protein
MKKQSLRLIIASLLSVVLLMISCKKETASVPKITFTNNLFEGTANAAGEYTITGHISSAVRLDKVVLTKKGATTSFLIDESTAKNKNEYDFSYNVTGITSNTYIVIEIFDQNGGKTTVEFLVKK